MRWNQLNGTRTKEYNAMIVPDTYVNAYYNPRTCQLFGAQIPAVEPL